MVLSGSFTLLGMEVQELRDNNAINPAPISEPASLPTSAYSIAQGESPAVRDFPLYTPEQTTKIQEIEAKYNINIFTVQQARVYAHQTLSSDEVQALGIDNWEDTSIGFSDSQLDTLSEVLSYLPENFYGPIKGKQFGIILRGEDFKEDAGEAYTVANMIGVGDGGINPANKPGDLSLLGHERMHLLSAADPTIQQRIEDILGDRAFIRLPEVRAFFENRDGVSSDYTQFNADQQAALATFSSFAPGQSFGEGISGLAQLYLDGEQRFVSCVGPIADGGGYSEANNYLSVAQLVAKYPKAAALYDLYKTIFKGREYNTPPFGGAMSDQMQNTFSVLDSADKVHMQSELTGPLTDSELTFLRQVFGFLPQSLYAAHNGNLNVVLVDNDTDRFPTLDMDTVYVSRQSFMEQNSDGVSMAIVNLAHDLAIEDDALNGYKTRDKIVQILGGDAFLNSPESVYPQLAVLKNLPSDGGNNDFIKEQIALLFPEGEDGKIDATQMLGNLAMYYIESPYDFVQLSQILDGKDLSLQLVRGKAQNTKTYAVFQALKNLFGGKTYANPEVVANIQPQ